MNNKDLIKQYVNTGLMLPEYQVNKLSNNDFKSYIRLRLMSINNGQGEQIAPYEYLRMDEDMRNNFVNSLNESRLYDAMYYLKSVDDFVIRVMNSQPLMVVKDYLSDIIQNSNSRTNIISALINKFGYNFNARHEFRNFYKGFDSDEAKYNFSINYLKGLSQSLGNEKMTAKNSPIASMVYYLDNNHVASIAKHFIAYNLKKQDGKTLDEDTFFTILNNINDANFEAIVEYMLRTVDLTPNQIQFIKDERQQR